MSTSVRARGIASRADLIRARAAGRLPETAEILGFERLPRREEAPPDLKTAREGPVAEPAPVANDAPLSPTPFWRPESYRSVEAVEDDATDLVLLEAGGGANEDTATDAETAPTPVALNPPLGDFADLLPGLRRAAAEPRPTRSPDMRALLRRVGRGEIVDELPSLSRRRWGSRVRVVSDHSPRLGPYRADLVALIGQLRRVFPRGGLTEQRWLGPERTALPPAGTVVIALGDLGTLVEESDEPLEAWAAYGRTLVRAGCRPVAVLPAPPLRRLDDLARYWALTGWRPVASREPDGPDRADQLAHLTVLAAPAVRIEPGLLRGLRLMTGADAALEAAFWNSAYVAERHEVAASVDPKAREEGLRAFARLDRETRKAVLDLLRAWRRELPWVWIEEITALDDDSKSLLPPGELDRAAARLAALADSMAADAPLGSLSWILRLEQRLPPRAWDPTGGEGRGSPEPWRRTLHRALVRGWQAALGDSGATPPPGFDPSLLQAAREPRRRYALRQHGADVLVAPEADSDAALGVPLGIIDARRNDLILEPFSDFWATGVSPPWADAWGCDETGPWVEFSVDDSRGDPVVQRLRWIPSGTFMMGSPDSEPERTDDEGPQHTVTISQGFWMFETACTQALWRAVTGENPSRFKGDDRPVDSVSWNDCVAFIAALNDRRPGLDLALPTEAQWEYACRAGTDSPFSFGVNIDPTQVNYDGNLPYRRARKGLYRQETVPVATLSANDFGLFEMHGNVWEWCADGPRDYAAEAVIDPAGPTGGAGRVLRGGSWIDAARRCRSAFRDWFVPDVRSSPIGFRCARVQDGAEPGGSRRIRPAERRIAASLSGGAKPLRLVAGGPEACGALPLGSPFVIRSDCEHLTFGLITKPGWASAIGRDRFGLWTEFEIGPETWPPVRQRMRWIPPGRFTIGSPPEEPGRFEWEGPAHSVTLSTGYWMFDTPCTQALWEAVTGANPSYFKSPDRPVDNVSWNDCREFLAAINKRAEGLDLTLPTEAQWEYACRAGTTTALYSGDIDILGERKAPALDPIAWYGGNSGRDFDLDEGWDISDWKEKQYQDSKAGSRKVKRKASNPWGLYDMIGNVYEWCEDGRRDYSEDAVVDPVGLTEGGAGRVLRGGSWYSTARYCRSACRIWFDPDDRDYTIGFRCARAQG